MQERKTIENEKRGLRGWKAFLVIVGSGTLAALLVMGAITGVFQTISSTAASPESEDGSQGAGPLPGETGDPVETLPPNKLNVCDRSLPAASNLSIQRVDEGENYSDTAEEESSDGKRVVSDECQWELNPDYTSIEPWDFHISYEAIISADSGEDKNEIASEEFDEWKEGMESEFSVVESERGEEFGDKSYMMYGDSSSDDNKVSYSVVGQDRSAVYKITLESRESPEGNTIPEDAFRHEMEKMDSQLNLVFGLEVPE